MTGISVSRNAAALFLYPAMVKWTWSLAIRTGDCVSQRSAPQSFGMIEAQFQNTTPSRWASLRCASRTSASLGSVFHSQASARDALAVVSDGTRQVAVSRALSLQCDGSSSPSGGPIITMTAAGSTPRILARTRRYFSV